MDSMARWLFVGLFALLPIFFVPLAWVGVTQGKVILVTTVLLAGALLWGIARLLEGAIKIPWTPVIAIAALIPISYAISTSVHGFESISLIGTGTDADSLVVVTMQYALLLLSALLFSGNPSGIVKAVRGFLGGSAIMLVLQAIHFALPTLALGGVFTTESANSFGGWHEFSMLLGLILFLGVALQKSSIANGVWKYILFGNAAISVLILVLGGFFDVWACVIAACVALLIVRGYKEGTLSTPEYWRKEWLTVVLGIASLFFLVFGGFVTNALPDRINVTQIEVRPSWQGTMSISRQALSNPLNLAVGAGPNTFTREWGLYKSTSVNQTLFWNTDFQVGVASIPTTFITTGILGVLAWILFLVALIFFIARSWISGSASVTDIFSIGVLYLLAFHAVSVPGVALSMFTFLFVGLYIASRVPHSIEFRQYPLGLGNMRGLFIGTLFVLFLAAALVSSVYSLRVIAADLFVNRGIATYNLTKDTATASSYINRGISIYPSDRAHRSAVELGLLQLREMTQSADPNAQAAKDELQATLERVIQHGLSAVSLGGGDYQNWLGLASLYGELAGAKVPGAYDNARAAYERARAQNPTSPLPLLNLARLEILQEKPDAALQYLAEAVRLKPDYAAAYYVASQAYLAKGDSANALQAAGRAVQYAQDDSQAWYNYGIIAYDAKKYDEAAQAMEQALARQDRFANALYILGLSYYELKRPEDAIKTFESLLALDPNQDVVKKILENLKNGLAPISQPAATPKAKSSR